MSLSFVDMDDITVREKGKGFVIGANELAVVGGSSQPRSTVSSGIMMTVVSSEVAPFLQEFENKTPKPYLDWRFWEFERPLVLFGNFWVSSDGAPYLRRMSAKHGDFTANFRLGAGLGRPMLSLLSRLTVVGLTLRP